MIILAQSMAESFSMQCDICTVSKFVAYVVARLLVGHCSVYYGNSATGIAILSAVTMLRLHQHIVQQSQCGITR